MKKLIHSEKRPLVRYQGLSHSSEKMVSHALRRVPGGGLRGRGGWGVELVCSLSGAPPPPQHQPGHGHTLTGDRPCWRTALLLSVCLQVNGQGDDEPPHRKARRQSVPCLSAFLTSYPVLWRRLLAQPSPRCRPQARLCRQSPIQAALTPASATDSVTDKLCDPG